MKPLTDLEHIDDAFITRMNSEIHANRHKGEWCAWQPTKDQVVMELQHHIDKLTDALNHNETVLVGEYAADGANILMKIYQQYGVSNKPLESS